MRDGTDIEMQLTFDSEMKIMLAKFSLDGTWLGMEEMSTQVSGLCRVGEGAGIARAVFFFMLATADYQYGLSRLRKALRGTALPGPDVLHSAGCGTARVVREC